MIACGQRQERDEAAVRIDLDRRAIDGELRVSVADRSENEIGVARLNQLVGTRVHDADLQRALNERDRRERDGGGRRSSGGGWCRSAASGTGARVRARGEREERNDSRGQGRELHE